MADGVAAFCNIAEPVAEALRAGRPVVALESTLITHGFAYPRNREVASACEAEVRAAGAVPATVAIKEGRILIGLDEEQIETLATTRDALKASRGALAAALSSGGWASTTVSATMIAAHAEQIDVFATGGLGGVHRGALANSSAGDPASFDISADLTELARTPVIVVCAGPKAILDVPLTMEYLETQGVPVVTLGSDEIPGFYSTSSGVPSPMVAANLEELARMLRAHLELGLGCGALVCVPIPHQHEIPRASIEAVIESVTEQARHEHIQGRALTPWLLSRIAEETRGAAVAANVELLLNNARTAARLAVALRERPRLPSDSRRVPQTNHPVQL